MRISIESTDMMTEVQGVTCRIWRGVTERGTRCELVVPLIRVKRGENAAELDAELKKLPGADVARKVGIFDPWDEPVDLRRVL